MFTKNSMRGAIRPAVLTAAIGAVVIGGLVASPLVSLSATPVGIEKNGGARQLAGDQTEVVKSQIKNGKAKNVILLIGDGMGDSEITVARDYQYGAAGRLPGIDALPMTGQYTTYSLQKGTTKPDYVPDSAATGTAWSTGTKTYDNAISVDTFGKPQQTLLELAKKAGLKTGDVTTSELQDATPAVQVAHISARSCYGPTVTSTTCASEALENGGIGSITEQLLNTRPDVTLGGGAATFAQAAKAGQWRGLTLNEQAIARGYQLVGTKDELAAVTSADQSKPVLGLFAQGNMPVRWGTLPATIGGASAAAAVCPVNPDRHTATQPSLAEMTTKAIDLLKNDKGFFLQVEGASIDKQDHAADACGQIGETIDLDEAVQVALEYAKKDGNTTVIVTADHAHTSQIVDSVTPGLSVNLLTTEGSELKVSYGTSALGGSQQHTGTQLRVAGYGPGAANFVGLTDQTDMFFTIRNVLGLEGAQPLAEPTPVPTVASPAPTVTVTAAPGAVAATAVPTISGSVKVGSTLTATAGTWNVSGLLTAYQWLRDGSVIAGATGATHKVVPADAGAALSVRVTVSKTGVTGASSYSAPTVAVPRVSPKITSAVSGKKLTIKVSGVPSVTGDVSVYAGSAVVARDVSVKGGKATISLAGLDKGKSTLKIVFGGSSQLLPKTVNAKVTIK